MKQKRLGKRIASLLLCMLMVLALLPLSAIEANAGAMNPKNVTWDKVIEELGIEGEGTDYAPYQVSDMEQLYFVITGEYCTTYNGSEKWICLDKGRLDNTADERVDVILKNDITDSLKYNQDHSYKGMRPIHKRTMLHLNGHKIICDVKDTPMKQFVYIQSGKDFYVSDKVGGGEIRVTMHPTDKNKAPGYIDESCLFFIDKDAYLDVLGGTYTVEIEGEEKEETIEKYGFAVLDYGSFWMHSGTFFGSVYKNDYNAFNQMSGTIHGKLNVSIEGSEHISFSDLTIYSQGNEYLYYGGLIKTVRNVSILVDDEPYINSAHQRVVGKSLKIHPQLSVSDTDKQYIKKDEAGQVLSFELNTVCTDEIVSRQLIYEFNNGTETEKRVLRTYSEADVISDAGNSAHVEYPLNTASVSDGIYYVKTVRKNHGEEYSEKRAVQVYEPLNIISNSGDMSIFNGSNVKASVTVEGTGVSCDWSVDGNAVEGFQNKNIFYVDLSALEVGSHTVTANVKDATGLQADPIQMQITIIESNDNQTAMGLAKCYVNGYQKSDNAVFSLNDTDEFTITYDWENGDYAGKTPVVGDITYNCDVYSLTSEGYYDTIVATINDKETILASELANGLPAGKYGISVTVTNKIEVNGLPNSKANSVSFFIDTTPHTHDYSLGGYAHYNSNQHKKLCDCAYTSNYVLEDHNWDSSKEIAPTYIETGYKVCQICGYEEIIPTLVCPHAHVKKIGEKDATCEAPGNTGFDYCTDCKIAITVGTEVQAKDHDMTRLVSEKVAATCTEDGKEKIMGCSRCDHTEGGAVIAKTGHTVVTDEAVAATCTTNGKTEGSHCSVCHEIIVAQTAIEATGHKWDEGVVTKEPTYDEEGTKEVTCTVCKATENRKIDKLKREEVHIVIGNNTYTILVEARDTEGAVLTASLSDVIIVKGKKVTFAKAKVMNEKLTGYTFKRFYMMNGDTKKKVKTLKEAQLTDNLIITAEYTENTYLVKYKIPKKVDGQKVVGKAKPFKAKYTEAKSLIDNETLTLNGHKLVGFTDVKNAAEAKWLAGSSVKISTLMEGKGKAKSITLYPVWEVVE